MKHAVVLLSGGVDSSTTLAIAIGGGFETYALSFDYGQRRRRALSHSRAPARAFKIRHHSQGAGARCRSCADAQLLRSSSARPRLWIMRCLSVALERFPGSRPHGPNSVRVPMKSALGI